jgi:hypothetical protein
MAENGLGRCHRLSYWHETACCLTTELVPLSLAAWLRQGTLFAEAERFTRAKNFGSAIKLRQALRQTGQLRDFVHNRVESTASHGAGWYGYSYCNDLHRDVTGPIQC